MSKNDYKQIFKSRFRTLWAYGFDSAAPRAAEKLKIKVGEKRSARWQFVWPASVKDCKVCPLKRGGKSL